MFHCLSLLFEMIRCVLRFSWRKAFNRQQETSWFMQNRNIARIWAELSHPYHILGRNWQQSPKTWRQDSCWTKPLLLVNKKGRRSRRTKICHQLQQIFPEKVISRPLRNMMEQESASSTMVQGVIVSAVEEDAQSWLKFNCTVTFKRLHHTGIWWFKVHCRKLALFDISHAPLAVDLPLVTSSGYVDLRELLTRPIERCWI